MREPAYPALSTCCCSCIWPISLGYQVMASVSMITGYFDLRHQVHEPGFEIDWYRPVITTATGAAKTAGLAPGDTVESLNGLLPIPGRAVMQSTRFYVRPDWKR